MILQEIENKLKEIDPIVIYGKVLENSLDEAETDLWNYIVFNRTIKRPNTNKTSYTDYFAVHIVRENYVPEGLEEEVIEKVCELPGVRVAGDGTYNYVNKPNTNVVVEMFSIEFYRAKKV